MAIYGSDFDRIDGNNTSMDVYGTAAGNWGGTIHSKDDFAPSLTTVVKSGTFGSSKDDYTSGIYVGGLNYGALYAPRVAIVEGGYIYNILGGPLTDDSREDKNDIFINQKGGEIDVIVGGAGRSETYGNRIINVTGGKVNYAVFGGSNGYSGNNSNSYRGTLTSSTFVYVGGNAEVGDTDIINSGNEEENGTLMVFRNLETGKIFSESDLKGKVEMINTIMVISTVVMIIPLLTASFMAVSVFTLYIDLKIFISMFLSIFLSPSSICLISLRLDSISPEATFSVK